MLSVSILIGFIVGDLNTMCHESAFLFDIIIYLIELVAIYIFV